uniref:Uncharacterized protein n=1 Tax=Panagrolaimus sp. ES5 TaxID=591445 RepID=A0AC34FX81_9BILA
MDSSTYSTTTSNLKSKAENSAMIVSQKRASFLATYQNQNFPFRNSLMQYITMNPASAKAYKKLTKSCKNFFVKNPILVLWRLENDRKNGWQSNVNGMYKEVNFKCSSKFWITDSIDVYPSNISKALKRNILSSILPKIYRCDILRLSIEEQTISVDELSVLISNVENFILENVTVMDRNGSLAPIEDLLKLSSKFKAFDYKSGPKSSKITSKTFQELLKIPHFHKLSLFSLQDVPEDFDIESFYTFMKKNNQTLIILSFSEDISDGYKNRLEEINDEIIGTEDREYKPPYIVFDELDQQKKRKIYSICFR